MTTVKINGRELLLKECPECHREVISLSREFVDEDASLCSKLAPALRPDFEVHEGEDYKTAYKLLQESELDVLLLGLPIASGGSGNALNCSSVWTEAKSIRSSSF